MPEDSPNIRLLKGMFSKDEWEYFFAHGAFQYQLKDHDGTSKSYKDLVKIGELLLRQKAELRFSEEKIERKGACHVGRRITQGRN
jgi:hypothetical protein